MRTRLPATPGPPEAARICGAEQASVNRKIHTLAAEGWLEKCGARGAHAPWKITAAGIAAHWIAVAMQKKIVGRKGRVGEPAS